MSSQESTTSSRTEVDPQSPSFKIHTDESGDENPRRLPLNGFKELEDQNEVDAEKLRAQRRQRLPSFAEDAFRDPYLVDWNGPGDPRHPLNWSKKRRWFITALSGVLILNATFASSAPSGIS